MNNFNIQNNVISEYVWKGQNVICPWGIEFADDNSFFSLEKGISQRVKIIEENYKLKENIYNYNLCLKLNMGLVEIQGQDIIEQNKVVRKIELVALENTNLLDFVMRFRFTKAAYDVAEINKIQVLHKNTNKYYQYECDNVKLSGNVGRVKVRITNEEKTDEMTRYMYVRDNKNEWVVHARMLPKYDKNIVIKLCSKWFNTRPLPKVMTNLLCANKNIYSYLKYHNETKPYKNIIARTFNPNAYPMAEIAKGETLKFEVEVLFSE